MTYSGVAPDASAPVKATLPSPVDVFAEWFRSVPPEVDVGLVAALAIARIDRRAPLHPDAVVLRAMFAAFAGNRRVPRPALHR